MGTKRANNEGNIKRRADGRWEARITLEDGTRRSLYAKTRQDVSRLLTEALRNRDMGIGVLGNRQTTGQYLESWLETCRHTLKVRTWNRYAEYVRLHAIPVLGKIHISKLTAQQVQDLTHASLRRDSLQRPYVICMRCCIEPSIGRSGSASFIAMLPTWSIRPACAITRWPL